MINIVAVITAKPGNLAEILAAFRAYLPTVLAEEGCIDYTPLVDTEGISSRIQTPIGADTLMVIEKWSNIEALRAHGVAANTATFTVRIDQLAISRVIHVLSPA
jgi:quinol monooxygenase YgiN